MSGFKKAVSPWLDYFRRLSRFYNRYARTNPTNSLLLATYFGFAIAVLSGESAGQSTIEIGFFDKDSGEPISARIEFTEPVNRYPKPKGALIAGRQILVEKTAKFTAPFGKYEFRIRRGPEFNDVRSGFELQPNAEGAFEAYVPRKTPMRSRGWYSGDLLSSTSPETTRRWMRADDLDVAATLSTSKTLLPSTILMGEGAGVRAPEKEPQARPSPPAPLPEDRARGGNALNFVQSNSVYFDKAGQAGVLIHRGNEISTKESTFDALKRIEGDNKAHVEICRPWERDVPLLLATERIDSVQMLSEHLLPDTGLALSAAVRNPDKLRFKGKHAVGRIGEFVYWQMLEAGLHLPPTAGTGFDGKSQTHLGYNRVYVHLDEQGPRDVEDWWANLKSGKTMVGNGPLMTCSINGLVPGSHFDASRGQPVSLDITLELTVRDPVEYLDVVFNGAAIYQAKLEDHSKRGQFPDLTIDESGWLVLRVVTEHQNSYRMTTTAPFYFEFDSQPRVSRSAVNFFREWLTESIVAIEKDSKIQNDAASKAAYHAALEQANAFWSKKAEQANAE
jgi:hypothetical protein